MKTKNIYKILAVAALTVSFGGCTDVVDVDVQNEEPRLVIEASLDWEITENGATSGNNQTIKLRMSTPYFSEEEPAPVTGAVVYVTNDTTGVIYPFEDLNNGTYSTHSFEPVEEQSFTLTVEYNGEVYRGSDTFYYGTIIEGLWQSYEGGFDSEAIDVNIAYYDNPDVANYYLLRFYRHGDLLPYLEVDWDEFTNGNLMTDFFEINDFDENAEPLQPGEVVDISIYGLSENYFNYMAILLYQSDNTGNPFSTVPVALKGNCKNITGGKDAYGYFRTTTYNTIEYTIVE